MTLWVPLSPPRSQFLKFQGEISSFSQKDALALFSHPHCTATVAPTKVAIALANRQQPCQGVATLVVGVATLLTIALATGGSPLRAGRCRLPLCREPWS
ncbi:hypothetical protein BHE74_00049160 [Ensete ventricosum]|nr:hypothetical protein BHE74_00049160 [Ensete ventricosum]